MYSSDCNICKKEVTEKCNSIACDVCDSWYHSKCVNLSDSLLKRMGGDDGILWICEPCRSIFRKWVERRRDNCKNESVDKNHETDEIAAERVTKNKAEPEVVQEWKLVKGPKAKTENHQEGRPIETKNKYDVLGVTDGNKQENRTVIFEDS